MSFYIHLDDPGFPEHPWPGQRRLGPYDTLEEATRQAVHDAAHGHGLAAGIYTAADSDMIASLLETADNVDQDADNTTDGAAAADLRATAAASRAHAYATLPAAGRDQLEAAAKTRAAELQAARDADTAARLEAEGITLPGGVTVADLRAGGAL